MLLEPLAHIRNAATFALHHFRTEIDEERLDIPPGNVAARGACEHQLQGSLALPFQIHTVLEISTTRNQRDIGHTAV